MQSKQLKREVKGLRLSDDKFVVFATDETIHGTAASSHCLVDIDKLKCTLEQNAICIICKDTTLSLTSTLNRGACRKIQMTCRTCSLGKENDCARVKNSWDSKSSSLGEAANVHLILASYYLGKAGHAIAVIAGALGLPNVAGVNGMYYKHYDVVGAAIRKVTGQLEKEALESEIVATLASENKKYFDRSLIFDKNGLLLEHLPDVGIDVAYDMGWQKRSSGHKFDSPSGHGFLVGCRTRKVIGHVTYSKWCRVCSNAYLKNSAKGKEHICPMNYSGKSSKSMEPDGAVKLVTDIHYKYNKRTYVNKFVSDDDSSTRKILTHEEGNNKGELPPSMRPPQFLCDVNHRIKVMAKPFFALAGLSKRMSTCSKLDAIRIKRNLGWYIRGSIKNPSMTFEDFVRNAKAPVLHHFDDHRCCDASWCWKKDLDDKEHLAVLGEVEFDPNQSEGGGMNEGSDLDDSDDDEYSCSDEEEIDDELEYEFDCSQSFVNRSTYYKTSTVGPDLSFLQPEDAARKKELIIKQKDKFYRSMTNDEELFNQMMESLTDHITPSKLRMLWHDYDTSVNEGMNYSVATFAPKNFNFSGSMSLNTRVSLAVGVHLAGHAEFWKLVLSSLDVPLYRSLYDYLAKKDKSRVYNHVVRHNNKKKLKRSEKMRDSIIKEMKYEVEANKSGKTYKSGMAMERQSAKKIVLQCLKNERSLQKDLEKDRKTCKYYPHFCDIVGHCSAADKQCKMHGKTTAEKNSAIESMENVMIDKYLMAKSKGKYLGIFQQS